MTTTAPAVDERIDTTINPAPELNKNELEVDLNAQWTEGDEAFLTLRNMGDNWIFIKIKGNSEAVASTVIRPVKTVLRPKAKERILFRLNSKTKTNLKQGDNAYMFLIKFNVFDLDQDRGGFKNLRYNLRFCMVVRNDFAYRQPGSKRIKDQVSAMMIKFEPYKPSNVGFEDNFEDGHGDDDSIPVTSLHVVKFLFWAFFLLMFYNIGERVFSLFDHFLNP